MAHIFTIVSMEESVTYGVVDGARICEDDELSVIACTCN